MIKGFFDIPIPVNEPVLSYANGTKERQYLLHAIEDMYQKEVDIPMIIGDKEVRGKKKVAIRPPHNHKH